MNFKTIITTKKNIVKVDINDYSLLNRWKWSQAGNGYPYCKISGATIYMHKLIMGAPGRKNFEIDHINRDVLDNRKNNLRWCSHSFNLFNTKLPKDNKSGFKGVRWDKQRKGWVVFVSKKYIGRYKDKNEAIKARIKACKKIYGGKTYHGII